MSNFLKRRFLTKLVNALNEVADFERSFRVEYAASWFDLRK